MERERERVIVMSWVKRYRIKLAQLRANYGTGMLALNDASSVRGLYE